MHPAPLVTHPTLYYEQAVLVNKVVGAILHGLVSQLEEVFTIQPVSQVSEQDDSDIY